MHYNYYNYLQVDIAAEQEVIEAAYKRLCKKYHPDLCKESYSDPYIKKLNALENKVNTSFSRALILFFGNC